MLWRLDTPFMLRSLLPATSEVVAMDPTVRSLTKDIARDVSSSLDDSKPPLAETELLTLIVISALNRLEAAAADNDELQRVASRSKRAIERYEPGVVEHNKGVEAKGMDLGQYAHTKVFEGKDAKASKFARLMGGAKEKDPAERSPRLHAMYAPRHDEEEKRMKDIESEYVAATTHKGKKGLGSA